MRTFLTRTYDDDNNNNGDEQHSFFRQQPTLDGFIPGRGVVGDFYDDDNDENDNNGNNYEDIFYKGRMMTITTMKMTATNNFIFLGNN